MSDIDAVVSNIATTTTTSSTTTQLEQMNLSGTTSTTTGAAPEGSTPTVSSSQPTLPYPTVKRDYLRTHERHIQQLWMEHHVFESNAPATTNDDTPASFFVTFPYPYMNGVLHIGHAFSFSKALFRSLYEQLQNQNTLLPFAFHCTGMPIQAVTYIIVYFIFSNFCILSYIITYNNYLLFFFTDFFIFFFSTYVHI